MGTNRDNWTEEQKRWVETIESDPELFLALAEESGLAEKIRKTLDDHKAEKEGPSKKLERLGESIAKAGQFAGLLNHDVDLTGPQLLLVINDMARAAKETVDRNNVFAKFDNYTHQAISEDHAIAAIRKLDKTYYRRWAKDIAEGETEMGYICGNIPAVHLATVIEYTRQQFATSNDLTASQEAKPGTNDTPAVVVSEDERIALDLAIDALASDGNGFSGAGAAEILGRLQERTGGRPFASTETPRTAPTPTLDSVLDDEGTAGERYSIASHPIPPYG